MRNTLLRPDRREGVAADLANLAAATAKAAKLRRETFVKGGIVLRNAFVGRDVSECCLAAPRSESLNAAPGQGMGRVTTLKHPLILFSAGLACFSLSAVVDCSAKRQSLAGEQREKEMTISGIQSGNLSIYQIGQNAGVGATGGDRDGGGRVHRGGGRAFMNSIMQTLSQLGLAPAAGSQTAATGATGSSGSDADGDNDGSGAASATNAAQALHAFMHTLFQTLAQGGTAASSTGTSTDSDGDHDGSVQGAAHSRYADLTSKLQSLIQSLGTASGTNGSQGGTAGDLQTAYQNLVVALNGGNASSGTAGSSGSAATPPDLQTFLQDLLNNLNGQQSTQAAAVGGVVSSVA